MTAFYYPPSQNTLQKTLGAQLLAGVTASASLNNVTGIQNKAGVFVVDRVDTNNVETPTKREYVSFAGTSGLTVITLVRNVDGSGTDQDHAIGAIVEFCPNITEEQAIIDNFLVEHNNGGTHKSTLVTTLKATGAVVNTGTSDVTIVTPKAIADSKVSITDKAETFTNKRVTRRIGTTASSATPTINTDNVDIYAITAQTEAITSFTTNLSGTPTGGDMLLIEITGTTAREITWGTSFEASTVSLPTTTVTTAMLSVLFKYNSATSKWRVVAVV